MNLSHYLLTQCHKVPKAIVPRNVVLFAINLVYNIILTFRVESAFAIICYSLFLSIKNKFSLNILSCVHFIVSFTKCFEFSVIIGIT